MRKTDIKQSVQDERVSEDDLISFILVLGAGPPMPLDITTTMNYGEGLSYRERRSIFPSIDSQPAVDSISKILLIK